MASAVRLLGGPIRESKARKNEREGELSFFLLLPPPSLVPCLSRRAISQRCRKSFGGCRKDAGLCKSTRILLQNDIMVVQQWLLCGGTFAVNTNLGIHLKLNPAKTRRKQRGKGAPSTICCSFGGHLSLSLVLEHLTLPPN